MDKDTESKIVDAAIHWFKTRQAFLDLSDEWSKDKSSNALQLLNKCSNSEHALADIIRACNV